AADLTCSAVTAGPKQFQLFQPSAGVNPMVAPQTILKSRFDSPSEFFARSTTLYSPLALMEPEMKPVAGPTFSPPGRLSTAKVMGRFPLAGMLYMKGLPGRTPKTLGPLIRGVGGALGVRIILERSSGALVCVAAGSWLKPAWAANAI